MMRKKTHYYLQNITDSGYTLSEALTKTRYATAYSTVSVTPEAIDYFTFNSALSKVKGTVALDGSLTLKLYYSREAYNLMVTSTNADAGTFTNKTGAYSYGEIVTLSATTNPGYTFLGWYDGATKVSSSLSYTFAVNSNMVIMPVWEINTNTAYTVKYYFQNTNNDSYTLDSSLTMTLTGVTNTLATIRPMEFDHFTFNSELSTISGIISSDGTLVLSLYYTRNTYNVTVKANNAAAGTFTDLTGTYKYGATINLSATTKTNFQFLGWYNGAEKLASSASYAFIVEGDAILTATWVTGSVVQLSGSDLTGFGSWDYYQTGTLITEDGTYGGVSSYSAELGTYYGKQGVLKLSGSATSGGGIKITLPRSMTQTKTGAIVNSTEPQLQSVPKTTITLQMYVVSSGTSTFGLYQTYYYDSTLGETRNFGWNDLNFTPVYNQWFYHTVDVVTGDHVRFGVSGGNFEFYVAGIYQGDVNSVIESKREGSYNSLGTNELANFNSANYAELVTASAGIKNFQASVGTYHNKNNVLKIAVTTADSMSGYVTLNLPKAMSGAYKTQISFQMLCAATAGSIASNAFGISHGGWENGLVIGGGSTFDSKLGTWQTYNPILESCDYVSFFVDKGITIEIY